MATTTEFLGLTVLEKKDNFNVNEVFNNNVQIIDEIFSPEKDLINFYIQANSNTNTYDTFIAERGMTFNDFINSEYNTSDKLTIASHIKYDGNPLQSRVPENTLNSYVMPDEEICPWFKYILTVCCFEKGTQIQVSLEGDTKNIEDIQEEDEIVSYDEDNKTFIINKVIGLRSNPSVTNIAKVTLENGTFVRMNAYHPLLTVEGYKSLTQYEELPLLTKDDILITSNGECKIQEIEMSIEQPERMYNLCMSSVAHNYIANSIVVHNAGCK